MNITRYDQLNTSKLFNGALATYRSAFEDINRLAIERHMMTYEEFSDVVADRRVQKWIAAEDSGDICGMAVITNDLLAVPLISPAYFEHHMPELYKQDRIFYVQFVCTEPTIRSVHAFHLLIAAMQPQVQDARGCAVMDFCDFNVEQLQLPEKALVVQQRYNPTVRMRRADSQHFYIYDHSDAGEGS